MFSQLFVFEALYDIVDGRSQSINHWRPPHARRSSAPSSPLPSSSSLQAPSPPGLLSTSLERFRRGERRMKSEDLWIKTKRNYSASFPRYSNQA